jgi:heme-degrading monooxygenase HmoA
MIARTWRGQTTATNATVYFEHVTQTILPSLGKIPGHCGAYVLRRDIEGGVEFVVMTLWESMRAVSAFSGEPPDRAVVEPQARAVLESCDHTVKHFEVAYGTRDDVA